MDKKPPQHPVRMPYRVDLPINIYQIKFGEVLRWCDESIGQRYVDWDVHGYNGEVSLLFRHRHHHLLCVLTHG